MKFDRRLILAIVVIGLATVVWLLLTMGLIASTLEPAQRTLLVSWAKRRKKGREMVAALPSRFIAEMALNASTVKENPREKLKALRAEFAQRAERSAAAAAQVK